MRCGVDPPGIQVAWFTSYYYWIFGWVHEPVYHPRASGIVRPCFTGLRVHLIVCTVNFTIFTVAVTVFLTFVFLNFESENTGYRYR